jgi:hypothetical protein
VRLALMLMVGTAHERFQFGEAQCLRLCPPYDSRTGVAQRVTITGVPTLTRL